MIQLASLEGDHGWLGRLVPCGPSKGVFIFAAYCYSVATTHILVQLLKLGGFWPTRLDPNGLSHYIRPGIDTGRVIDLLVISPIIESLVLIGALELLRLLRLPCNAQVIGTVLLSCLLHNSHNVALATWVAPALFIQVACYLYWKKEASIIPAIGIVMLLHFLLNCIPALVVLSETGGQLSL